MSSQHQTEVQIPPLPSNLQAPVHSQTHTAMTSERPSVIGSSNSLRDIYLEIPASISKYLMEAGITSFLNCIEIQKKLILTCHYILHRVDSIFDEGRETISDETSKVHEAIIEILKNEYLKKETMNFESNDDLCEKVVKVVDELFGKEEKEYKQLHPILKFLKGKTNSGQNGCHQPLSGRLSMLNTGREDGENDKFRKYYNLGPHDIINEAEDIATHLMNEVKNFSKKNFNFNF